MLAPQEFSVGRFTILTDPRGANFVDGVLVDLDRLPRSGGCLGALVRQLDPANPEIDDRSYPEQMLAAGVSEVPASLGRRDPAHQVPTPTTQARGALETGQACLELGQPSLRRTRLVHR